MFPFKYSIPISKWGNSSVFVHVILYKILIYHFHIVVNMLNTVEHSY